jgi:hypothetical protein
MNQAVSSGQIPPDVVQCLQAEERSVYKHALATGQDPADVVERLMVGAATKMLERARPLPSSSARSEQGKPRWSARPRRPKRNGAGAWYAGWRIPPLSKMSCLVGKTGFDSTAVREHCRRINEKGAPRR